MASDIPELSFRESELDIKMSLSFFIFPGDIDGFKKEVEKGSGGGSGDDESKSRKLDTKKWFKWEKY